MECRKAVSVIVPCYNVSKYVRRCVDSIMNQSYPYIELIAINDSSTDDTFSVLQSIEKDYQGNGKCIKLINLTSNVGLGTVRDIGVDNATGQYIMFVDSDDWISLGCISSCVSLMEKYQADMIEFGYKRTSEYIPPILQSVQDDLMFKICESNIEIEKQSDHIACNKLFRTDIIKKNGIKFKYRIFEDTLFTRKYAFCCTRAVFVENVFYSYYCNQSSITSSIDISKLENIERINEIIELYNSKGFYDNKKIYIEKSIEPLLKNLIRISYSTHRKFCFSLPQSEYAKRTQPFIDSFNKNKFFFRIKAYRYLGLKKSMKIIYLHYITHIR